MSGDNGKQKKDLELKKDNVPALRVSGGKIGEENQPAGFEGIEEGDIKIARLGVAQGLSQVVNEGKAKMGDIFNNISQEVYGDSVEIIPLFMFKTRAQFDVDRGLLMMSRDNIKVTMAIDEFEQHLDKPVEEVPSSVEGVKAIDWDGKNPPEFCLVYNFPCLLVGQAFVFPLSLSMMKTAAKVATNFLSMARYSGEDMFARVYKVSSRIIQEGKKTYAVPVIQFARRCTDQEYALGKKFFEAMYKRKADIEVALEEENTE